MEVFLEIRSLLETVVYITLVYQLRVDSLGSAAGDLHHLKFDRLLAGFCLLRFLLFARVFYPESHNSVPLLSHRVVLNELPLESELLKTVTYKFVRLKFVLGIQRMDN